MWQLQENGTFTQFISRFLCMRQMLSQTDFKGVLSKRNRSLVGLTQQVRTGGRSWLVIEDARQRTFGSVGYFMNNKL